MPLARQLIFNDSPFNDPFCLYKGYTKGTTIFIYFSINVNPCQFYPVHNSMLEVYLSTTLWVSAEQALWTLETWSCPAVPY